ncbi:SDR family NAD(P)-dependent oxidoreductase [Paenibacillus lignilyticus]|uniref:SDR family NAD(P)-dependent oxidoreductase n=1 Tax=Paenibacillus lignilyticus TaxID=1172615 RepID=UPI0030841A29
MKSDSSSGRTNQSAIPSGFGSQTTAREALGNLDLTGKIALVTGGYSGIGLETSRVLAEAGATVIVPARTPDKARSAVAGIPRLELEMLDLMDPSSIDGLAERFLNTGRQLDMLINSAGIMAAPLNRDARGYESQFATNHLGHFQLTARLWPALRKANGARVVSVSSRGHRLGGVDFDDPSFHHREYDKWKAYGQSKSANALFAVELDHRGKAQHIRAFSVHPGLIMTDLSRHLTDDEVGRPKQLNDEQGEKPTSVANADTFKTVEQGAATSVWCATSEQLIGKGACIARTWISRRLFQPTVSRASAFDRGRSTPN